MTGKPDKTISYINDNSKLTTAPLIVLIGVRTAFQVRVLRRMLDGITLEIPPSCRQLSL